MDDLRIRVPAGVTVTKHPGDPRSDVFGEQQFDPNEYPGVYVEPPKPPPVTPNVLGFVPYRGGEQHGVALEEPGKAYLPYASEALAHSEYSDPTITPRDITNIDPVKVEIVSNPTLINRRHIRFMSYNYAPSATPNFQQIVQSERFRKRCVVTATGSASGTATLRIATTPDASTVNSALCVVPTGQQVTMLDAEVQSGLYVWVVTANDPTVIVSCQLEYYDYEGSKLL